MSRPFGLLVNIPEGRFYVEYDILNPAGDLKFKRIEVDDGGWMKLEAETISDELFWDLVNEIKKVSRYE